MGAAPVRNPAPGPVADRTRDVPAQAEITRQRRRSAAGVQRFTYGFSCAASFGAMNFPPWRRTTSTGTP